MSFGDDTLNPDNEIYAERDRLTAKLARYEHADRYHEPQLQQELLNAWNILDTERRAVKDLTAKLAEVEAERDPWERAFDDLSLKYLEMGERLEAQLARYHAALAEDQILEVTILFHHIYERLAGGFEYETKKETRIFDPESPNGRLMLATVKEILADRRRAAGFDKTKTQS
mgnify:CR=1 FL=1